MSIEIDTEVGGGGGGGGVESSLLLNVSSKSDLPAPVADVITSPPNVTLNILENIDLGLSRLVISDGGGINGIRRTGGGASTISGTTTGPLISANNSGDYIDIGFSQLGTGDIFQVNGTPGPGGAQFSFTRTEFLGKPFRILNAFALFFIATRFTGGSGLILDAASNFQFLGCKDTTVFDDSADADIGILIEGGAALGRLILDTVGFNRVFASKSLVVEDGATLVFMEIQSSAFNLFNSGAKGIELANPDAIGLGTLNNTTFFPGATAISSNPVSDSVIDLSSFDPVGNMILNGNLWITEQLQTQEFHKFNGISNSLNTTFTFGTNPLGITNDGVNVIIGDAGTGLTSVMVGESNTVDFSFASGGVVTGMAFDGQDIWIVDPFADLVIQHDGKTAVIKNTWATASTNPLGVDIDGAVVLVTDSEDSMIQIHEFDGTFLYEFPTGFASDSSADISHQEDQYVLTDIDNKRVLVYDKNIAFHQGSKNWSITECNIPQSATRIVSRFKSAAGTTVTPLASNDWTDIADAGVSIIWGAATEGYEKLIVTDAKNGTIKSIGVREITAVVSANVQLARSTGSTIDIEVGIFLNADVISASVFSLLLDSNNKFTPTLPSFMLRLKQVDEIRLRFRNLTNANAVDFFSGTLSA